MSIATYLTALDRDRDALAANLTTKGVPALSSETFTTLVPKVLDIPSGSGGGGTEITSPVGSSATPFQHWLTKMSIDNPFIFQISGYSSYCLSSNSCKELYIKSISPTSSTSYSFINSSTFPLLEKLTIENLIFDNITKDYMNNSSSFLAGDIVLKEVNLTVFNCTASTCYGTLRNCTALTKAYVDLLDSSNTSTSFRAMFRGCTALKEVTVKLNPATTGLALNELFYACSSLEKIDVSGIDFNNVTNHSSMLNSVPTTCTIYVKDAANQALLSGWFPTYTFTIKT